MSGEEVPKARPLRPGDPTTLGSYRITGRLGEGGMGSVYLASAPDGRLVALKVIRDQLADNLEFRRRFRSEVARAREVPPFCTAEVIDADTEHDPPYLVVEYVDGPSLASVVQDRGPLTPANQHGLAVGVAVALTAIHGAGVIHRDLKPSNVLLAPGSPKVIDFGIARGVGPQEQETRTDQLLGTVAYMAPERFGGKASGPLTPASDVFSWGAVIAYAATGRTPFGAEVPAAIAVRIMTEPPNLDGLTGPLRDLVELSLAKNPSDRPTARELLDNLLAGGGSRLATGAPAPVRTTAFPQQPEVLAAAGIQATQVIPTVATGAAVTVGAATTAFPTGQPPYTFTPGSAVVGPGPAMTTAGADAYAPTRPPRPPGPRGPGQRPPGYRPPPGPYPPQPPRRRRGAALIITLLSLAVLALAGTVTAFATGALKLPGTATGPTATGNPPAPTVTNPVPPSPTPSASASSQPPPSVTPTTPAVTGPTDPTIGAGWVSVLDDSFPTGDTFWTPYDSPGVGGKCTVDGQLTANLTNPSTGSFRCKGIANPFVDVTVKVDVELGNVNSCAGIWFRYSDALPGGYALRICRDRVQVVNHSNTTIKVLREAYFAPGAMLDPGKTAEVAVRVEGDVITVYRDGVQIPNASFTDETFGQGRVVLGVFSVGAASPAPYQAIFHRVQVFQPAG